MLYMITVGLLQTALGGKFRYAKKFVRKAFGAMLELLNQRPFAELTVREIVWGFSHPLVKLGNEVATSDEERLPFDEFGFFVGVTWKLFLIVRSH